jgi:hypothetical protein
MKSNIISVLNKATLSLFIIAIIFFYSCNRTASFKAFEIRSFILKSNQMIDESIHQLNDSTDFVEFSDDINLIQTSLKTLNSKPEVSHVYIKNEYTFLNGINALLSDSLFNYGDSLQRRHIKSALVKLSEEYTITKDQYLFQFESEYKLDKRTR